LLLPPPQLPNAVALSAAIAAAVAITHLFNIAIKQQWLGQWHGQLQRKQWLRQRGWWANDGNNGNGDGTGNKMRNGDNKVVGDREGNGESGKSNDNGGKEGNGVGGKGNGHGDKEGKGNGRRGVM
jgi:hypothetical protein